jgi:hypothetical protein
MGRHTTRKATAAGRAETLKFRQIRRGKYATTPLESSW